MDEMFNPMEDLPENFSLTSDNFARMETIEEQMGINILNTLGGRQINEDELLKNKSGDYYLVDKFENSLPKNINDRFDVLKNQKFEAIKIVFDVHKKTLKVYKILKTIDKEVINHITNEMKIIKEYIDLVAASIVFIEETTNTSERRDNIILLQNDIRNLEKKINNITKMLLQF